MVLRRRSLSIGGVSDEDVGAVLRSGPRLVGRHLLPAVSVKRTGQPKPAHCHVDLGAQAAPRDRRGADLQPLFSVGGVLMGADDGGNRLSDTEIWIVRHRLKDTPPDALLAPKAKRRKTLFHSPNTSGGSRDGRASAHDRKHSLHKHPVITAGRSRVRSSPIMWGDIRAHCSPRRIKRSRTPMTASKRQSEFDLLTLGNVRVHAT